MVVPGEDALQHARRVDDEHGANVARVQGVQRLPQWRLGQAVRQGPDGQL
jgi:hypothetical protein